MRPRFVRDASEIRQRCSCARRRISNESRPSHEWEAAPLTRVRSSAVARQAVADLSRQPPIPRRRDLNLEGSSSAGGFSRRSRLLQRWPRRGTSMLQQSPLAQQLRPTRGIKTSGGVGARGFTTASKRLGVCCGRHGAAAGIADKCGSAHWRTPSVKSTAAPCMTSPGGLAMPDRWPRRRVRRRQGLRQSPTVADAHGRVL